MILNNGFVSLLSGSALLLSASFGAAAAPAPPGAEAASPAASESPAALPPGGMAPEPESRQLSYEQGGLLGIGFAPALKLGGSFSGAFSELGTSPAIQLELGYLLPVLERSVEIFVSGDYTQPTTERSDVVDVAGPDGTSRLNEPMSYELTQQEFNVTLGALYRLKLPVPMFRPYAALGARLYFMKTNVSGATGSEEFGENREGAVSPGFYGALGGELHIGPGAVLLEVQAAYAGMDGFVMRNTNVGAVNLALGYRLFL